MINYGMRLTYNKAAADWKQGLPIGNGRIGAVVIGGEQEETWCLTEATYWSGKEERTETNSRGRADLDRLRGLFFQGDYAQGEALAEQLLQAEKRNFGTHLSMCDIRIAHETGGGRVKRELDLEEAVYRASVEHADARRAGEVFASHPDDVIAARIGGDKPGGVSFAIRLSGRTDRFEAVAEGEGVIRFRGQAVETMHSDGTCGVRCAGAVKLVASGGTIKPDGDALTVSGADSVWIYVGVATDYGRLDDGWQDEALTAVSKASTKGYDRLLDDHRREYRSLYARVEADFGRSEREVLPTDERIRLLGTGGDDPQLFALFLQYGRYLTIAGSRSDSPLPLHLQGLWNDGEANRMAWSCDYHLDINTQMNYYPTEAANLAECHGPLMKYVAKLAEAGRASAADFYGCEGWTAHVFSNAWGFTAPGWHYSWGLNVTGGLWLAMHLRMHYEYGRDEAFLREQAYPVLKEAARFFNDYMVVHPEKGWLVTGPSNSPENSFYVRGGERNSHALSMGPTMDQSLVRELFGFCLASAEKLGDDPDFRRRLEEAIALLPPLQIGTDGKLQEWLEDYEEAQPDHRHLAHLYGLYPGGEITPHGTPELSEASRRTLLTRKREDGFEDVEFTLALFAASYARLHDGERAYENVAYLISDLCFDNLLTYSKAGIAGAETNIFVADGNFGGAAALIEMLLQSHAGEIHLLPALPAAWPTGRITGLKAQGNAQVDIHWQDGSLAEATILTMSPLHMRLRYRDRVIPLRLKAGESLHIRGCELIAQHQ
ncbi:glycoside hydrolase family 95 protein [Paenibacillus methanolicus]|uniref:Alpha-L-fucosidase 2 n=1 Tax=Paenibacillus methanolicus TaxID=582686 RepID=A0A5S5CL39_9BACL|nr:glycoside hydrolase family 95 protein [Paenibacillus methanolicus]TYP79098.1 alpha-L-fucosidase 2 [Paenibacillus methanolicus]